MGKTALDELYEHYISDDNSEPVKAKEIFNDIFKILEATYTADMVNELYYKVSDYGSEREEKAFKEGFKYAMRLVRECGI